MANPSLMIPESDWCMPRPECRHDVRASPTPPGVFRLICNDKMISDLQSRDYGRDCLVAAGARSLVGNKFTNCADDLPLLLGLQLRVHRQREDLRRHLLGHGEITLFVTEFCVRLLHMQRNWVVYARINLARSQMFLKSFAVFYPDYIQVMYGP